MVEVNGVPCRGALLRDVSAYLVTCSVVLAMFSSGRIALNPEVAALLSMYFAFILVVLAADVYHRAVYLPQQRKLAIAALMFRHFLVSAVMQRSL